MKRIEVEEKIFEQFEKYRGRDDESRAIGRLIKSSNREAVEKADRIALVILEDHWFGFKDNPGQASNAPFLEGVCRLVNNVKSYRLNFYDAASFGRALEAVATVPEQRIILYVGAHGSTCKVGAAPTKMLMTKIADFSRKRKIEGVLLSACFAGGNDEAMMEALKGGTNWIFAYRTSVDFLGSIQVEAAILEQLSYADYDAAEAEDELVKAIAQALSCFNPKWKIGEPPYAALEHAVRLFTRPKFAKKAAESTSKVITLAW